MPASIVTSFAQKTGKSEKEVEKLWDTAKEQAAEQGKKEDFQYITGILKKMLKIKESKAEQLINKLLSESVQTDREARQEAEDVFKYVMSIVKNYKDTWIQDPELREPKTKGLLVPVYKSHRTDLKNLIVVLGYNGQTGYVKNRGKDVIVLGNVLKGPYDVTYADTRMSTQKDAFVHEYVHVQDTKRYGDRSKEKSSGEKYREKDLKGYYNSPEEFNAHYQEIASNAEASFKFLNKYGKANSIMSSYDTFKKHSLSKVTTEFYSYLDSSNKRKLDKRLAQLYQDLKREM